MATATHPQDDWNLFAAIRKEELAEAMRGGKVQLVNVLSSPGKEVIVGTRHIPLADLEERLGELDRTWPVILYCKNASCDLSHKAARFLVERGFHVRVYEGGIDEWTSHGLPTEPPKTADARGAQPSVKRDAADPETKGDARGDARVDGNANGDAKGHAKADEKIDEKADEKVDEKADAKSDEKSDAKADEKADAKADEKSDEKSDAKSDEKADAKVDANADDKVDAKGAEKADAKMDAKADAKDDA